MTRKHKAKLGPVLGSALAVAFGGVAACSDTFTADDCVVTHTCEPRAVAGAAGADDSEESPSEAAGGASGTGTGGNADQGAGARDGAAAGAEGEGGADASVCPYDSCDCEHGQTRACGPEVEEGICKAGTQACAEGAWGECLDAVEAQGRDCTSPLDKDCDGEPDNVIDESCKCVPGTTEACGEHPGLDGNGPCQAGERTCTGSGASGVWGPCVGAVGPKASDKCDAKGDDSDCDGQPNGGCACIAGEKSNCGDVYAATHGECVSIALTCTSTGKWPSSSTCNTTQTEVCDSSFKDENCNGVVDENCDCPEASNLPKYDAALIGTCCRTTTSVGYVTRNAVDLQYMVCKVQNLAASKPATSDSEALGFPASNTTDDSMTSLWKAQDANDGHWVLIDLEASTTVQGVVFKFEGAGSYGFKLETSNNGASWVVKTNGTSAANATSQDIVFARSAVRYVRITLTSLPTGKSAALSSVRVY